MSPECWAVPQPRKKSRKCLLVHFMLNFEFESVGPSVKIVSLFPCTFLIKVPIPRDNPCTVMHYYSSNRRHTTQISLWMYTMYYYSSNQSVTCCSQKYPNSAMKLRKQSIRVEKRTLQYFSIEIVSFLRNIATGM